LHRGYRIRGTEGSNPASSSGESRANLTSSIRSENSSGGFLRHLPMADPRCIQQQKRLVGRHPSSRGARGNVWGKSSRILSCEIACVQAASLMRAGSVEEGRGSGPLGQPRLPSPLISRVEDWRAGLGRCRATSPVPSMCFSTAAGPRPQTTSRYRAGSQICLRDGVPIGADWDPILAVNLHDSSIG
jgi:hypothetical protein